MRVAMSVLLTAAAVSTLPACNKKQAQPQEQNIAIGEDGLSNGMPANADIEELPPDESSGTSANELQTGDDNPDVNDLNGSANSY
jgi:hypothetical protein